MLTALLIAGILAVAVTLLVIFSAIQDLENATDLCHSTY